MATSFTINKLDYGNAPAGSQLWTIEYKLFSDTGYTLLSNSASVNTDGTLVAPITQGGLTDGQLYYVRATPNCVSPATPFIQAIQL